METLILELPAMYADHHVIEVRKILLSIPSVTDVYASSAFRVVKMTYDPVRVDASAIQSRLGEAGYLEDVPVPLETSQATASSAVSTPSFRRTTTFLPTGRGVSFAQRVDSIGRSHWPCPGLENSKTEEGKDGKERT